MSGPVESRFAHTRVCSKCKGTGCDACDGGIVSSPVDLLQHGPERCTLSPMRSEPGSMTLPDEARAETEITRVRGLDTSHELDGDGNDLSYERMEYANLLASVLDPGFRTRAAAARMRRP